MQCDKALGGRFTLIEERFMAPNPLLGILLHAIGGFAAGSFYAPIKKIKGWGWETAWLVMGLAAWLACPWIASSLTTPQLQEILQEASLTQRNAIGYAILFGFLWGFGNLTYGLAARYLGIALGGSVALGFCMLFGTLVPPMFDDSISQLWETRSGMVIFAGIALCAVGIMLCGEAGRRRDIETSTKPQEGDGEQFHFGKGMLVATVAGILSACFAFGLAAGKPIADIAVAKGTNPLYQNNVVLIFVLTGGFLSSALSCLTMNLKNKSFGDYVRFNGTYFRNLFLVWVAGVTWFCQFFFYGMGQTKLGEDYHFASWSIHMAFIVVFLNLWGLVFHEWRGTSQRTKSLIWIGILVLIASTVVIGVGNKFAASPGETATAEQVETA
jgi:L-rhamnose-H+ transport protein